MGLSQADIDALMAQDPATDSGAATVAESAPVATAERPAPAPPVAAVGAGELDRIRHLSVPVSVKLAECLMSIRSILGMTVGTIIEFQVPSDTELHIEVSNATIGSGQAVKVGENFGLRISNLGSVRDRIRAMGSG